MREARKKFKKTSKNPLTTKTKTDILNVEKGKGTPKNKNGLRPTQERKSIMTNREFYEAVIKAVENEELKNFAKEAIEKLNHRNESRANKPNKTQIANEPIKMAILDALTTEPTTASVIAERVEISTQKASALCRQLVADGKATVTEVKVAKKGIQKGYAKA